MTTQIARNVRIAFASLTLALTLFVGIESLTGAAPAGMTACGTAERPCELAPLTVKAGRAPSQLAGTPVEAASLEQAALNRMTPLRKS
ncbi:MAG TPA: hypothetical protein VFX98_15140 [Longimicrobiaceae bacterium]|nr:hypothetical protein [Longimicrobiaceae bacterium]